MDNNRKLILEEFEQLKGQFVITNSWKVERLVAVGEDEMDYYWITYNGRRLNFHTCVGRVVPLKGKLDDKDYNEFERLANLNHYDRFIGKRPNYPTMDEYKQELVEDWGENDKLLTDIIFRDDVE